MEPNGEAKELLPNLVPPSPTGAPVPAKFVRTLPSDMHIVEEGGTPELAPLTESAPSRTPAVSPSESTARDVPAIPEAPAAVPAPSPATPVAPMPASSLAASPIFGEHDLQLPSKRRQSWGAILAVIIIVVMIIVGAFYAWGQRIAAQYHYPSVQQ